MDTQAPAEHAAGFDTGLGPAGKKPRGVVNLNAFISSAVAASAAAEDSHGGSSAGKSARSEEQAARSDSGEEEAVLEETQGGGSPAGVLVTCNGFTVGQPRCCVADN
jgi:hypothetical protein